MPKLSRKTDIKNKQGNTIIFAMIVVFIVFIIGASLVMFGEHETKKSVASIQKNTALYIAEGGVRKAIWELNHDGTYTGEAESPLGEGNFTVSVITPAGLNDQRQILSKGNIGPASRTVKVICERITTVINVSSAVQCAGDVSMTGNCNVDGGSLPGVLVPVGNSVSVAGSASLTGTPASGNAPFPAFEDVFGVTMAQMQGMATTTYTNPGNNPACSGITWVEGELKATNSSFNGSGILIVNGDFSFQGGVFNGVIYVTGEIRITGNGVIHGAILGQSTTELSFAAGTPELSYDGSIIDTVGELFPFHILNWQEVKN